VAENTTASYAATASFSDGSTQTVTASAVWSEDSTYASIAAGVLTAGEVPSDQSVAVTAAYTFNGVTLSGSLPVTITNATLTGSHVGRFTDYTGTATCLTCHTNEATQMHQSVHYQWKGDASESDGLNSATAGKLGGINDFCIYPDINWIGKLTNADGVSVDGGCARCHAGLGAKPEPSPSQAQLENIDCLLCHSKNYKRTVGQVNGVYKFVPNTAAMTVSLLQAAVDITLPDKNTCLNCHTKAGGGDNFKRGDIEEAHRTATPALDVHMASTASGGAGLQCLDCHTNVGHRIAGRGIDMRQRDIPNAVVCQNCHSASPHASADLNRHTTRVNCNTCHIPEFAKVAATDMVRDWSQPGDLNPATKLYEPHMTLASHVQPEYVWFNGRSTFYQFGDPAVPGANGKVLMAGPQGSVQDPAAKINPVKHHFGKQPADPVTKRLFPLKIGIFFSTGDVNTAVAQGAAGVGWAYSGHEFADTERFMGLYHEVAPAAQALQCASCHDNGDQRMNFGQLGYTPKTTRNGQPLCSSCHGAKTASFYTVHNKHVRDKGINCIECHTFSQVAN
jgi:phage tail protein X